jgi:hypothetical protein
MLPRSRISYVFLCALQLCAVPFTFPCLIALTMQLTSVSIELVRKNNLTCLNNFIQQKFKNSVFCYIKSNKRFLFMLECKNGVKTNVFKFNTLISIALNSVHFIALKFNRLIRMQKTFSSHGA